MQKKRKSLLLLTSMTLSERICTFFGKSVFFKSFFANRYASFNQAFERGFWKGLGGRENGRATWQYRLRRAGMRAGEESFFLRLVQRGTDFLLSTAVSSFGVMLLLTGGFWVGAALMSEPFSRYFPLFIPLILMISSIPLLHETRSLAVCLLQSRLCSAFLLSLCEIPEEGLLIRKREERRFLTIFGSCLFGSMGYWIEPKKILLAALATLVFFLFVIAPELPMLLLLAAFPFLGYTKHPTLILLCAVLLIQFVWFCKILRGRRTIRFELVDFLVLLMMAVFLMGGITTVGRREAIFAAITRATLLSLYFPAVGLFVRPRWRKRAVFLLLLSGGACAFLGILQYFQGKAALQWVDLSRFSDIGGRVTAGFSNPNVLSVYLLLVFPLSLAVGFSEHENIGLRIFSLGCCLTEGLCLIFTWSRGAWLGALLAVLLFFLLFSHQTRGLLMLFALPCAVLISYLPHNITNRFASIGSLAESSIRYRLYVWRGTWRMIRANPFGIGLGQENFYIHYLPYAVSGTEGVIHTHQIFLQLICELGFPGLLLFLTFLTVFFLCVTQTSDKALSDSRAERFGGSLAVAAALAAGFFDHIWYHYGVFAMFWVMVALASSHTAVNQKGGFANEYAYSR